MKRKNTNISFYCFLAAIVIFIIAYVLGAIYNATGFSIGVGYGWIGYILLTIIFVLPIVGLVFGFKGEKNRLKFISIVGNLLVFLTVGVLSVALIIYDFVPQ
ncbi:hypothetical protein ACTNDN_16945 [Niallia sp. HCP3S3_B10]|uniref:hypothetical protein n=1 Tax=Niallia sp. HCP3S3_B10 TaxID=3438944 RepID=UPI003F8BF420